MRFPAGAWGRRGCGRWLGAIHGFIGAGDERVGAFTGVREGRADADGVAKAVYAVEDNYDPVAADASLRARVSVASLYLVERG
jgi:hypothetical protein